MSENDFHRIIWITKRYYWKLFSSRSAKSQIALCRWCYFSLLLLFYFLCSMFSTSRRASDNQLICWWKISVLFALSETLIGPWCAAVIANDTTDINHRKNWEFSRFIFLCCICYSQHFFSCFCLAIFLSLFWLNLNISLDLSFPRFVYFSLDFCHVRVVKWKHKAVWF